MNSIIAYLNNLSPMERMDRVNELNDNVKDNRTLGFVDFINSKHYGETSLLDIVKDIYDNTDELPFDREREFALNDSTIKEHVSKFFWEYFPNRLDEVMSILNGTNPYFIDEKGEAHVNFVSTSAGDGRISNVSYGGDNNHLEFNVYIHNSIDDLRTTAHELIHAISAHHKTHIDKARVGEKNVFSFENDCVNETASIIVEELFNLYLYKNGLYSKREIDNYKNGQIISLFNETKLIKEETEIVSDNSFPLTIDKAEHYIGELIKNNDKDLLKRIFEMCRLKKEGSSISAKYMFRYVVGRIVADQWIQRYIKANSLERKKMLRGLEKFLDTTYTCTLDEACEDLLKEDFNKIVDNYILDYKKQQSINAGI